MDTPDLTKAAATTTTATKPPAAGPEVDQQPKVDLSAPADEENDWAKYGAIILASEAGAPAKNKAKVIVVQTRTREPGEVTHRDPSVHPAFVDQKYPDGDVFVRFDKEIDFGDAAKNATVLTMGYELDQLATYGLEPRFGQVAVGPASPVYVAVNVAFHYGATKVKIFGVEDEERARLDAFFADGPEPAYDKIEISFA